MNRLGLDIIKIKSFSNNNISQKLALSSESVPKIVKQDSVKALDHKYILSPIKLKSAQNPNYNHENKIDNKNWEE